MLHSYAIKLFLPILCRLLILIYLKVSFNTSHNKFSAACVYRPLGSCSNGFLDDFLTLAGLLSSISSDFLICNDVNIHIDVDCHDRCRFNDITQCCNLVQGVTGLMHILGHTLDVLLTPRNSNFAQNIRMGDFISDHAVISCQLDFYSPAAVSE